MNVRRWPLSSMKKEQSVTLPPQKDVDTVSQNNLKDKKELLNDSFDSVFTKEKNKAHREIPTPHQFPL